MQTFLPYSSFYMSASCLDDKRLGKQRVECKQILIALGVTVGQHEGRRDSRWRNHPAVLMWSGYELSLAKYAEDICCSWRRRGFRDTLLDQFRQVIDRLVEEQATVYPWWMGIEEFHAAHRSNLLRKNPEWYGRFKWAEGPDLPYVWPQEKGGRFAVA